MPRSAAARFRDLFSENGVGTDYLPWQLPRRDHSGPVLFPVFPRLV